MLLPVEEVVLGFGHGKAVDVLREVVHPLVVSGDRHVGNVCGGWLDLPHETVSTLTVVVVEIISEIP